MKTKLLVNGKNGIYVCRKCQAENALEISFEIDVLEIFEAPEVMFNLGVRFKFDSFKENNNQRPGQACRLICRACGHSICADALYQKVSTIQDVPTETIKKALKKANKGNPVERGAGGDWLYYKDDKWHKFATTDWEACKKLNIKYNKCLQTLDKGL